MWCPLRRVGVLVVHSVLLTVCCQRGQEIEKNLWYGEPKNYLGLPQRSGWRFINICWFYVKGKCKHLKENYLVGIPEGHKRLILNMVSCLRMPYVKDHKLCSPYPQRKVRLLNLQWQEAQWSQCEASILCPTIRQKLTGTSFLWGVLRIKTSHLGRKTLKFDTWNLDFDVTWKHVLHAFVHR